MILKIIQLPLGTTQDAEVVNIQRDDRSDYGFVTSVSDKDTRVVLGSGVTILGEDII